MYFFFFFKQKTAYEMRISDWSSDVCSSDLVEEGEQHRLELGAGDGRDQEAERQRADDEQHHADGEAEPAAGHGDAEQDTGKNEDQGRLDEDDDDIGRELADHDLERLHGSSKKTFQRAALLLAGDDEGDRKSIRLNSSH